MPNMKYKVKEGKSETRVQFKAPGRVTMTKVVLKKATQGQLKDLAALGHPFVEEVKPLESSRKADKK